LFLPHGRVSSPLFAVPPFFGYFLHGWKSPLTVTCLSEFDSSTWFGYPNCLPSGDQKWPSGATPPLTVTFVFLSFPTVGSFYKFFFLLTGRGLNPFPMKVFTGLFLVPYFCIFPWCLFFGLFPRQGAHPSLPSYLFPPGQTPPPF